MSRRSNICPYQNISDIIQILREVPSPIFFREIPSKSFFFFQKALQLTPSRNLYDKFLREGLLGSSIGIYFGVSFGISFERLFERNYATSERKSEEKRKKKEFQRKKNPAVTFGGFLWRNYLKDLPENSPEGTCWKHIRRCKKF